MCTPALHLWSIIISTSTAAKIIRGIIYQKQCVVRVCRAAPKRTEVSSGPGSVTQVILKFMTELVTSIM